jgi:hypothetical protein
MVGIGDIVDLEREVRMSWVAVTKDTALLTKRLSARILGSVI